MQQQISIITLAIEDISKSKQFYINGFGWQPIYQTNDTLFYQMNGFILSTWLKKELERDIQQSIKLSREGITLAHFVSSFIEVQKLIDHLSRYGGTILRNADSPEHGGVRGYIADPDGHIWEIVWNLDFIINEKGYFTLNK